VENLFKIIEIPMFPNNRKVQVRLLNFITWGSREICSCELLARSIIFEHRRDRPISPTKVFKDCRKPV